MATSSTNPYLALTLFMALLFSSASFASVANMGKYIQQKKYKEVFTEYNRTPKKKLLLKNPNVVMYLAIASEKLGAYKQSYYLYLRLLLMKYGRYYRFIQKQLDNGDFIEAEKIPKAMKVQYWKVYTSMGKYILSIDKINPEAQRNLEVMKRFSVILTELAFRENIIEKLDSEVDKHLTELKLRQSEFVWRAYIDAISWQREVLLSGAGNEYDLVITNQGLCAGGSFSYENHYRSYFLDGCFVYGSGSISNTVSVPQYDQGGVPVFGLKFAPGVSFFVSEDKAEIGFKTPIFYNKQDLEQPGNGYTVDNGSDLSFLVSIYSRWPVKNWFFHTEFSKFIDQDTIMWSAGIGIKL